MKKQSTLHRLRKRTIVKYPYKIRHHAGTRDLRPRRSWRQGGLVALVISGILLIVGAVLGKVLRPGEERRPVSHMLQETRVVIVKDDTLPPVMQRIARCESQGQHFTKDGKVVRGKRNPQDTGLFQINTAIWGKKAQELGYDIHSQEGNQQMARYLFENYGSVPWQTSAACWRHAS
jgi:hypothetical protein